MTLTTDLQSYQSKRLYPNWKPKAPTTNYQPAGGATEEVVKRCLHFLELELQVADWCLSADVEAEVKEFLKRNAADEDKHDEALRMLSSYYGNPEPTQRALELIEQWRTVEAPQIATIYALEMGVFFSILPTLLKHGDVYAATVALWINDDERVHVETNLRIMRELGQKLNEKLALIVFDTVAYIYEPLGAEASREAATRAVKRLVSGRDNAMLKDSLPITIAFFEQRNNASIVY